MMTYELDEVEKEVLSGEDYYRTLEAHGFSVMQDGKAVIVIGKVGDMPLDRPSGAFDLISPTRARRFDSAKHAVAVLIKRAPVGWRQFAIRITIKMNLGSFGIKHDRQGEFRFCAQSAADARAIAGHHVADEKISIDVTRLVEVVDSVLVGEK